MRRLVYADQAQDSLDDIAEYVFRERGERAAEQLTDLLREKCRSLAGLPGMLGRARPEFRPDLRSFALGNYVIFFRYVDDVFEVVDVLDGRRDLDRYFSDE
ncbi:type II toxin-antitoxin system RelE/ParE family toxin [Methylopila sp. M107]|uniref:type II toxin-antitoxin system RelE/ParE family toxin n=1 Tax=Methylopila sp. M107 TaxID=1101190 RepID=UPI00037D8122|nr:type II toxin-antitoxin system RelE/ParE family toxin [Methylopila sp. M107]